MYPHFSGIGADSDGLVWIRKSDETLVFKGFADNYGLANRGMWCREGESNPHDVTIAGF